MSIICLIYSDFMLEICVKKTVVEKWYKICDILFLLFNYNIYICTQLMLFKS